MKLRADGPSLTAVLGNPQLAALLNDAQWSYLIATARHTNLLGALSVRLQDAGVPIAVRPLRHLAGAQQLSQRQHRSVFWEVHQLQASLGALQIPVVLLKGAAYVMTEHGIGKGRLFGDIDLLVPRDAIGDVESQLMLNGWVSAKTSAYDQRYYRQWMHEIPPMSHIQRGTVVDVHHTILPLTTRHHPDPAAIIARALPLADSALSALRVPTPQDLVIHSITHLVHEGELGNGLRDLYDIDCMLRHFGPVPGFWEALQRDAIGNDLAYPVALGLRLAQRFWGTAVPSALMVALQRADKVPSTLLMAIYDRALAPAPGSAPDVGVALSRWLLYVRSHALRMPLRLIIPHLVRKAWKRRFPEKT
jgi:hypothetical protein